MPKFDPQTPRALMGRLMLTMLGGLAESERELIRARTGEARARAKACGIKMARPFEMTPHKITSKTKEAEGSGCIAAAGSGYSDWSAASPSVSAWRPSCQRAVGSNEPATFQLRA